MEEESNALAQLAATVNSLISAITALFETHPYPAALAKQFASLSESDTARELTQGISDSDLLVAQQIRKDLLSICLKSSAPRP